MNILDLSVKELSEALSDKSLSSVEIVKTYLDEIDKDKKRDKPLNAFTDVYYEYALKQSLRADKRISKGEHTALTGIPIAVKDNMNIKGFPTTCSSKILEGYRATYNATVINKLIIDEGMVPLGKTNMDEFAMGSSTETSYYGITRNPYDRDRIPGGSSGGSAAAVGGEAGSGSTRQRYGRLYKAARVIMRSCRYEANIRPCFKIRPCGLCIFSGSNWTHYKKY